MMQTMPNHAIRYARLDLPFGTAPADETVEAIRRFDAAHDGFLVKVVVFAAKLTARRTDCRRLQRAIARRLKACKTLSGVPAVTVVEQPPLTKDWISVDVFYLNDSNIKPYYEWFDN
ncbi:MAG: hypothetical protein K2I84_01075, partial [Bacteroidales bacterium]|nr:hypothetical protein [Bacteroidales bacterium]